MSSVRHVGTEEPCSDKDEDPPTVARGRVTTAKPTPMARDCDSAVPFLELPWFSEACQKGFLANHKECPWQLTCFCHSHWVDLASFSSGDRPAVKRHCSRSKRPLSLKQSPHITTLLSDWSNWQAPPSPPPSRPFSLLFFDVFRTTTINHIPDSRRQSQLAGSENPWLVMASSAFFRRRRIPFPFVF